MRGSNCLSGICRYRTTISAYHLPRKFPRLLWSSSIYQKPINSVLPSSLAFLSASTPIIEQNMSNPANPANPPNTVAENVNLAPSLRQLELRCRLLDIERRGAIWQCDEFRNLLSSYLGESTADQPVGGSQSASAQVAPPPSSASTSAQQQHPVRLCLPGRALACNFCSLTVLPSCPLVRVCPDRCRVRVPRRIVPRERRMFIQVTEPAILHCESTRCPPLTL